MNYSFLTAVSNCCSVDSSLTVIKESLFEQMAIYLVRCFFSQGEMNARCPNKTMKTLNVVGG